MNTRYRMSRIKRLAHRIAVEHAVHAHDARIEANQRWVDGGGNPLAISPCAAAQAGDEAYEQTYSHFVRLGRRNGLPFVRLCAGHQAGRWIAGRSVSP